MKRGWLFVFISEMPKEKARTRLANGGWLVGAGELKIKYSLRIFGSCVSHGTWKFAFGSV